jgi:rSAM/selenodomain-associated transferase 1
MDPGRRPGPGVPRRADAAIVLYARVPRPGRVKTRLAPPLTHVEACRLHAAFLQDCARRVRAASFRSGADAWVSFSASWEPPRGGPLASALRGFLRLPQRGGDLGERMRRTSRDLLLRGYARVILVGGDSPTLPVARLVEACRALRAGADLVLGPAGDGGYYLVGLRRDRPEIFRGVPWGSAEVLQATLRRARRTRIVVRLLRPWHDVDRVEDLVRLRRELRGRRRRLAPKSASLVARLAARGRLPV